MSNHKTRTRESLIEIGPREDQLAFDELPPSLRCAVRDLPQMISAHSILKAHQRGMSESIIIERLKVQSERITDEYYRNLRVNVDKTGRISQA